MNQTQQDLVLRLIRSPYREPLTPNDFLRAMGADDGSSLALEVLKDAISREAADDTDLALVIADTFGVSDEFASTACGILEGEWHFVHERIASMLGETRDARFIPALTRLALWVPENLRWDEFRSLARTATWEISKMHHGSADDALREIAKAAEEPVAGYARDRLGGLPFSQP